MIDYDRDIALLKRKIYRLRQLPDEEVDSLYRRYSCQRWNATWVEVWQDDVGGFTRWLDGRDNG